MSNKQHVLTAALVGAMAPDTDIVAPSRARSFSFASAVASINVGDMPAARVVKIDGEFTIEQANAVIATETEKLRGSVASAVSQARRKNPGAEYSIETEPVLLRSGVYILALVHRTV